MEGDITPTKMVELLKEIDGPFAICYWHVCKIPYIYNINGSIRAKARLCILEGIYWEGVAS
jgi:hypothetical protein